MSSSVIDEMLDPIAECLTPEVARRIADARLSPRVQARLDELADRCNEGKLTGDEREEYARYVELIDVISILQAKARRLSSGRKAV